MPNNPPVLREGEPIYVGERQIGFTLFAGEKTKSDPRQMASNPWEVISQHLAHLAHLADVEQSESLSAGVKNARNYLRQAVDLFRASQHARSATRPLLLYYSFMNLAVLLWMCRNKMDLPGRMGHGVSGRGENRYDEPFDMKEEIVKVWPNSDGRPSSVVLRLAQAIDEDLLIRNGGRELNLQDLLGQVPAVHRQYLQYGWGKQRIFRAIRSGFYHAPNGSGKRRAWVALAVEDLDKDARDRVAETDHRFGRTFSRCECGTNPPQNMGPEDSKGDSGSVYYFQSKPQGYDKDPIESVAKLCEDCRDAGMMAVLTGSGYRYYISDYDEKSRVNYLIAGYLVMFYLGSIARYQPGLLADALATEYGWLLEEFLASQGHQFVFHIASYVTGREVALPQAAGRGAEAW